MIKKRSSLSLQPFHELGDIFRWPFPRFLESWGTEILPQTPINISEAEDGYLIKAEVPGVKKEDISINIEGNELSLKIEKREEKKKDEEWFHIREIRSGSMQRTFEIPENANIEKINAEFENGVLKLLIPKKEIAIKESKKVEIK